MALPTQTLPLLGVLSGTVILAPHQIPYTDPNCQNPIFANGSAATSTASTYSPQAGFYGLQYIYQTLPFFKTSTTGAYLVTPADGPPVQFAGGNINSFGVYDAIAILANPSEFAPVLTTNLSGYINNYMWGHDVSQFYMVVAPGQTQTAPCSGATYAFQFPYLQIENIRTVLTGPGQFPVNVQLRSFAKIGANTDIKQSYPITFNNDIDFSEHVSYTSALVPSTTLRSDIYVNLTPTGANYTAELVGLQGIQNPQANQGFDYPQLSPLHLNYLLTSGASSGGFGLGYLPLLTNNVLSTQPAMITEFTPLAFDDATVTTFLNARASSPSYRCCVTTNGDFLLSTGLTVGSNMYILIKGDMSGYYKLVFTGDANSMATIQSFHSGAPIRGGGFGTDLTGNLWWGETNKLQPLLYASFDLKENGGGGGGSGNLGGQGGQLNGNSSACNATGKDAVTATY